MENNELLGLKQTLCKMGAKEVKNGWMRRLEGNNNCVFAISMLQIKTLFE